MFIWLFPKNQYPKRVHDYQESLPKSQAACALACSLETQPSLEALQSNLKKPVSV